MMIRKIAIAMTAVMLLSLAGCQEFSLLNRLVLPGEISLIAESNIAQRNDSAAITLTIIGGTAPYSLNVVGDDLYSPTAGQGLGTAVIISEEMNHASGRYTPAGAIGRMIVTVTDADEITDNIYITVIPATPTFNSAVLWEAGNGVTLDWSYPDSTSIDEYLVQISKDDGNFTDFRTYTKNTFSSDESGLESSSEYVFRLFALAGSYRSLPDEEIAQSAP